MYSEWASLQSSVLSDAGSASVLHTFPEGVGREVSCSVVRHLSHGLSHGGGEDGQKLDSEQQVNWTMEVLCYGLTLPLSDHETIRDCVNVYSDWLTVLTTPKTSVPRPILEEPNKYAQRMFKHLHNLFLPRSEGNTYVDKQALMCHRILRTSQTIAKESPIMTQQTWEGLLLFLLGVNDTLLAPPTAQGSIADQLCDRLVSVLFEIWLVACARCFPSPPLWKTLREMCITWRHHAAMVDQWNRFNVLLTSKVLKIMYGPEFPELKIAEEDIPMVPADMQSECVVQTWFRFLHVLGNPVDLSNPNVISQTPRFTHMAMISDVVIDPSHHPCLKRLPAIFLRAMKGVSGLVDAFLGMSSPREVEDVDSAPTTPQVFRGSASTTPPGSRKNVRSFMPSISGKDKAEFRKSAPAILPRQPSASSVTLFSSDQHTVPSPCRPKVNSVLHLFGAWLFDAGLAGCELEPSHKRQGSFSSVGSRRSSAAFPSSSQDVAAVDSPEYPESYESGRAEACGTLCRIFCSKRSGEEILPAYLSRFYLVLAQGLQVGRYCSREVMAKIVVNCTDLLRSDLKGVDVLLPRIVDALEIILPDRELIKFRRSSSSVSPDLASSGQSSFPFPHEQEPPVCPYVNQIELRRSSIQLLLSILCLPLHFRDLQIQDILRAHETDEQPEHNTFLSLKLRMVNLLIGSLQCEQDSDNTQMILGGMLLCVQDSALLEEAELQAEQAEREQQNEESENAEEAADQEQKGTGEAPDHESPASKLAQGLYSEYDSAYGLFVRCIHLVCQRLMSAWKTDLNVSLAALELLSGLAKVKIIIQDVLECKRAVKWICDYIGYQCSRPPPNHSRDLHSMIVAAFHCLTVWLVEHADLMNDKECLQHVLETVELGISGSKSKVKASDQPKYKGDKELKPASMRVKDTAEATLYVVMSQVGSFPPTSGPASLCTLLNEEAIMKYARGSTGEGSLPFRYFVIDKNIIMGVLEQPLGNEQDPMPTVTVLIRTPYGRHAWTMQHRQLSRQDRLGSRSALNDPGRPVPMSDVGLHHDVTHRNFPEEVDRVPPTKADLSIPTLQQITGEKLQQELDKLRALMDVQVKYETAVNATTEKRIASTAFPNSDTECKPPRIVQEFHPSRLFLSQLGFLSLDGLKSAPNSPLPALIALDSKVTTFHLDLELLDSIPVRNFDTVFVFYVKCGQKTATDILNNVEAAENVQPQFLEFLRSLGWPVEVGRHPGWTGHVSTSWKLAADDDVFDDSTPVVDGTGGSLFNGDKQVLYYGDISSEVAFVVPSGSRQGNCRDQVPDKQAVDRTSTQGDAMATGAGPSRNLTLEVAGVDPSPGAVGPGPDTPTCHGRRRQLPSRANMHVGPDTKVLVIWVESYDDIEDFPLEDLLSECTTGMDYASSTSSLGSRPGMEAFVIFIHPLKTGLFRVNMHGPAGRVSKAIPLVDGMVVSRRALGALVRQTAINICHRRRLDTDTYQPPHIRRKIKIQEVVTKYRSQMSEPEFYTALFHDV
ncbi:RALGAPB [Branchiostoma lanceolatum]|uniref:Ral GTPase-activating protein subunit beta n=1 Tax=Branchiostoma lanceolatum TaxID=7740 RepID=A0A8J9ZR61_BRALA|nr:RALGAPB [Branchiostoma lanceolatum]